MVEVSLLRMILLALFIVCLSQGEHSGDFARNKVDEALWWEVYV